MYAVYMSYIYAVYVIYINKDIKSDFSTSAR